MGVAGGNLVPPPPGPSPQQFCYALLLFLACSLLFLGQVAPAGMLVARKLRENLRQALLRRLDLLPLLLCAFLPQNRSPGAIFLAQRIMAGMMIQNILWSPDPGKTEVKCALRYHHNTGDILY